MEQRTNLERLKFGGDWFNVGKLLFGLLKGYEVLGEPGLLRRANLVVNSACAGQSQSIEAPSRQDGKLPADSVEQSSGDKESDPMAYGVLWEALKQYYEQTQNKEVLQHLKRSIDSFYANPRFWDSENRRYVDHPEVALALAPGLAAVYEYTGESKYLDRAVESVGFQLENPPAIDRVDLFARHFRGSQRFLWYLSKDFPGPSRREVSLAR